LVKPILTWHHLGDNCLGELGIYVHGVWATEENAKEQTERVYLSLKKAGYNIPLKEDSDQRNGCDLLVNLTFWIYIWRFLLVYNQ
jgi:hypothetical protein